MIEVNEYVRTDKGYIFKVDEEKTTLQVINFLDVEYGKIVKHSKELIDLIEVGDFVNGYRVKGKTEKKIAVDYYCYSEELGEENWLILYNDMIQTILTKEQYMANCYKVGGEQWD